MLDLFALFLPPYTAQLLLAGVGLALMFGIITVKRALKWILIGVFLLLTAPFVGLLVRQFPLWVVLAASAWFAIIIARHILESLLGPDGAGHVLGTAFVAVCRIALRCVAAPFWCARAIARTLRRHRGV